jgi:hypothetical protein
MTGVFQEIVEPERLVFTSSPLDKNGDPLFEVLNTVTFADERGKTKFTLHASVGKVRAEGVPHPAGMEQGWSGAVDRLRDRLAQELGENYDSCIVDYSGAACAPLSVRRRDKNDSSEEIVGTFRLG